MVKDTMLILLDHWQGIEVKGPRVDGKRTGVYVCSVQCAVCSVQCAVCSVQCTEKSAKALPEGREGK